MLPQPHTQRREIAPAPRPDSAPERSGFLNHLRFVAMACRVKRRTDLFEACALLHVNGVASVAAHAEALVRCLDEALGRKVVFHTPGAAEQSFDETWLAQLGKSAAQGDDASVSFLIGSRVKPEHRRLVRFLVHRIATDTPA